MCLVVFWRNDRKETTRAIANHTRNNKNLLGLYAFARRADNRYDCGLPLQYNFSAIYSQNILKLAYLGYNMATEFLQSKIEAFIVELSAIFF